MVDKQQSNPYMLSLVHCR